MTRSFLVLTVVMLVLGLAATGHFEHQALFLDDAGLSPTRVSLAFSIIGFVGLLIAMPVGSLVDSWGRRPVLATGLVTLGVAVLLMPWLDGWPMLLALLGIFAVGNLMTGIALETHAMDLAPERRRGYFLGTWLLVKDLIEGVAAVLAGAAFLLPGALATGVIGLVLLGMAAFLAVSRPPRP
jgi:MFS family permease